MVSRNGTLTWQGAGGNTDGFALFSDTKASLGSIKAPPKFLGDLSTYNGGTMSFDYKVLDLGAKVSRYCPIKVTVYSGRAHATFVVATPNATWPGLDWQSFNVPLVATDWHVSQTAWDRILANVTKITISAESTVNRKKPFDRDGFDNIQITGLGEQTPEPATLTLLCLGSIGVLYRRTVAKRA